MRQKVDADRSKCIGHDPFEDVTCPVRDNCLRHNVQSAGNNQRWLFVLGPQMENCEYYIEDTDAGEPK